jgi:predicted RND superfamily exporter protein
VIVEALSARLVDIQAESPWRVLGVLAVLTVLVVPGALNLEVKPSTEAILPGDDPAVESLDSLRAEFYGDTTHVVVQQSDVRKQEVLERLERVENRVEKLENVRSVTSPASMFSQDIPADRDELVEKDYRGTVSNDFDTALVSVRADTQANPSEIDKLHSSLSRIVETEMPSAEYSLTGYNMIDLATFQVIINDFIRITGVSFGAVLLVLYGFFRDPVQMLFPVVPVVFALVWMLGLGGYLGADLTIISMHRLRDPCIEILLRELGWLPEPEGGDEGAVARTPRRLPHDGYGVLGAPGCAAHGHACARNIPVYRYNVGIHWRSGVAADSHSSRGGY